VPSGWTYVHTNPGFLDDQGATKKVAALSGLTGRLREHAETAALRVLGAAGYVHTTRATALPGVSLIHSAERLIRNPPVPYVLDLEHVDLFVIYQRAAYGRRWTLPWLERMLLDPRLRYLLPWSDAARDSVLARVSPAAAEKLRPKMRTIYPAVRPMIDGVRGRTAGPLRVLFVGTKFYEKGGVEAVRSVRVARAAGSNVELDLVSYLPPETEVALRDEPGLRIHRPGGQAFIRDLYSAADVLLFPSHMDTYGVVVGEAMSYGVPVLAPDHLALKEIIAHGSSGLLFPAENMLYGSDTRCVVPRTLPPPADYLRALRVPSQRYVSAIAEILSSLADRPEQLSPLAAGALATTVDGRLSMKRRASSLKSVYDDAADSR
jgi:glycosyltransferase involved in cell wall biosynthesis